MKQTSKATDTDALFRGAQAAIQQVIDKAKREDRTLVISRNGKPMLVKARDL